MQTVDGGYAFQQVPRYRGDTQEVQGRRRGDTGEMQGRCRGDAGEIQAMLSSRCRVRGPNNLALALALALTPALALALTLALARCRVVGLAAAV